MDRCQTDRFECRLISRSGRLGAIRRWEVGGTRRCEAPQIAWWQEKEPRLRPRCQLVKGEQSPPACRHNGIGTRWRDSSRGALSVEGNRVGRRRGRHRGLRWRHRPHAPTSCATSASAKPPPERLATGARAPAVGPAAREQLPSKKSLGRAEDVSRKEAYTLIAGGQHRLHVFNEKASRPLIGAASQYKSYRRPPERPPLALLR